MTIYGKTHSLWIISSRCRVCFTRNTSWPTVHGWSRDRIIDPWAWDLCSGGQAWQREGLSMWDVIKFCDLCMAELQEWWIWNMGRSYYTTCPLHHKATTPLHPRSPERTEVNVLTSGLENSCTGNGRI